MKGKFNCCNTAQYLFMNDLPLQNERGCKGGGFSVFCIEKIKRLQGDCLHLGGIFED